MTNFRENNWPEFLEWTAIGHMPNIRGTKTNRLFPLLFGLPSFLTGGLRHFNRETFFHLTPEFGHIFDKTISQPRVRQRPFMPPAPWLRMLVSMYSKHLSKNLPIIFSVISRWKQLEKWLPWWRWRLVWLITGEKILWRLWIWFRWAYLQL